MREDNPLKGLLLGFGLAAAVTLAAELVCHLRARPRRTPADAAAAVRCDAPSRSLA